MWPCPDNKRHRTPRSPTHSTMPRSSRRSFSMADSLHLKSILLCSRISRVDSVLWISSGSTAPISPPTHADPWFAKMSRPCAAEKPGPTKNSSLRPTASDRRPPIWLTTNEIGIRSKQVMNSPLNQYYVTCMLVSRPIEDTSRHCCAKSGSQTARRCVSSPVQHSVGLGRKRG